MKILNTLGILIVNMGINNEYIYIYNYIYDM